MDDPAALWYSDKLTVTLSVPACSDIPKIENQFEQVGDRLYCWFTRTQLEQAVATWQMVHGGDK